MTIEELFTCLPEAQWQGAGHTQLKGRCPKCGGGFAASCTAWR
jgi:hypothetical protein